VYTAPWLPSSTNGIAISVFQALRSRLAFLAHLALIGLADEAHDVRQIVERIEADLHIAVAPTAVICHVLAETLWIVDLGERNVMLRRNRFACGTTSTKLVSAL
jgi:hypothetical protein